MAINEVAPGIYSFDHDRADGKNAIIIGQRKVVAVDVGDSNVVGQGMADFIRSQGRQPDVVILTHGHDDHVLGGAAFAGSEVYAHVNLPAVTRRDLRRVAQRRNVDYETLLQQALWPTVTYRDELFFDLGDKHLHLFPTPGHSEDGISIYVEEDRLLVAGDSVVTGIIPAFGDGDSRILQETLRKLLTQDIEVLIPGHGAVIYGAARVQDVLRWSLNYLSRVQSTVQGMIRDGLRDPEAICERIDYAAFVGDRLPVDKHGMPNRHRNTVIKMIEEEIGQDQS